MSLALPFPAETISDVFNSWSPERKSMGLGRHRGMDWQPGGLPIKASGAGTVKYKRYNTVLGWQVTIRYDDGNVVLGYNHMAGESPLKVGQRVKEGDIVGVVGNTGTATTGRHLHLTASWSDGDPGVVPVIDPMPFFGKSLAVAALAAAIIIKTLQNGSKTNMATPSPFRAFEQNQTPDQPGYMQIMVTGPGLDGGFIVHPGDRNPYNVLRGVLNNYSQKHGDGSEVLPQNAESCDATAWDVLTRVFIH